MLAIPDDDEMQARATSAARGPGRESFVAVTRRRPSGIGDASDESRTLIDEALGAIPSPKRGAAEADDARSVR